MGNKLTMSVNQMRGYQLCRKDDLMSLIYSCIQMVDAFDAPWMGQTFKKVINTKEITTPKYVCKNEAKCFIDIYQCINNLTYTEDPDYNKLRFMFQKIILDAGEIPSPRNLDWIKKKKL